MDFWRDKFVSKNVDNFHNRNETETYKYLKKLSNVQQIFCSNISYNFLDQGFPTFLCLRPP